MIHESDAGIFRSSPSEVVKKILVLNIFSNYKEMSLVKFTTSKLDALFKNKLTKTYLIKKKIRLI